MKRNKPPNQKLSPFDSYASDNSSVSEHPVDTAVRERVSEEALLERIQEVQNALQSALRAKHRPIWVELETLLHTRRTQREEAYFNVGHEFGELAGHAKAIRLLSNWNADEAKRVANDIRNFARRRTNLPPHRTVAALLEVAWSFALLIDEPPADGSPHGGNNGHNPPHGRN